ncbi:hypothetical protein [Desulfobacula toluolica]|uniref:hypothetical protein n=1 Tax=Desulfobacula toluolica TaxID=28223 RepID=UPI00068425BC|nr:hypothetical protein [Desulfobacula toluolica]
MEQILQNIADPSWWFTGTFFVVFGIALINLPKVWRKAMVIMPALNQQIYRWKELKILLIIKRNRQHEVKIIWLIGRYWCLSTVTIIYMGFLIISYILSEPPSEVINFIKFHYKTLIKYFPIVVPAYLLALFTMWEKELLRRIIEEHIKWKNRIKTHL